jgi:hypothetical protein
MLRAIWPTERRLYPSPAVRLGRVFHFAGLAIAALALAAMASGGFIPSVVGFLIPGAIYMAGRALLYLFGGE